LHADDSDVESKSLITDRRSRAIPWHVEPHPEHPDRRHLHNAGERPGQPDAVRTRQGLLQQQQGRAEAVRPAGSPLGGRHPVAARPVRRTGEGAATHREGAPPRRDARVPLRVAVLAGGHVQGPVRQGRQRHRRPRHRRQGRQGPPRASPSARVRGCGRCWTRSRSSSRPTPTPRSSS
jgi:hypothetical protein